MNMSTAICATLALSALAPVVASASRDDVEVRIVSASGARFRTFPVESESPDVQRLYLEARDQAAYRIQVRNRTGDRVGLVIAVDGRNIISGQRSDLARNERMYILDPWESAEYEGWRTGQNRVNEFYFTDWDDSYAEAFRDRSARGVIAVAIYPEKVRAHEFSRTEPYAREESGGRNKPSADSRSAAKGSAEPGTGFGQEVYSPSVRVAFDAQRHPASQVFIKYEWRDSLCQRGVIDCDDRARRERNRFWDEFANFGFAPYPPRWTRD